MLLALLWSAPAPGQTWNDGRTQALVSMAVERRARQLADTGLSSYAATAHGYLTFLAQVGEGFPDPPKVVKTDEIALEVYWRAPNHSKQLILGRRDTLLLPTDIQYHRDHLGIVQNNFPNIIRLGDGDEVRDVPHPLSPSGLAAYDFAISDSLRIGIPGRTIDVYEVRVRPRDDRAPAAVGAVYLARDDAQVVRMTFSFTRAALIDRQLEDVSIVLDNALIEERFWLPRRQEIEIRRAGSWLDFPARGIIRGRWEICCYGVNRGPVADAFTGPEIELASPERRAGHRWTGTILEAMPSEVQAVTDEDVRRVRAEARALVRAEALAGATETALSIPSLSEVARVSRAEGFSLGAGLRRQLGAGFDISLRGRYGFGDHVGKGTSALGWRHASGGVRLSAFREYRDARDVPEMSGLGNSLAAQEFGRDFTEPFSVQGLSLTVDARRTGEGAEPRLRVELAYERAGPVAVVAEPARGRFAPTLPVWPGHGPRLSVLVEHPPRVWLGGLARTRVELRLLRAQQRLTNDSGYVVAGDPVAVMRATGQLEFDRQVGPGLLHQRLFVGGALARGGPLPAQHFLRAGGPVSGPGFAFRRFDTPELLLWYRVEWRVPVPFPAVPLGRWGEIPGRALLAPLAHAVCGRGFTSPADASGCYPALGIGLMPFFELLRFDVARGLRDGRWFLGVDLSRDLWGVL